MTTTAQLETAALKRCYLILGLALPNGGLEGILFPHVHDQQFIQQTILHSWQSLLLSFLLAFLNCPFFHYHHLVRLSFSLESQAQFRKVNSH